MSAMFKFSYGLFVLSTKVGEKDNGCIINTAMQVTNNPKQIAICVNKENHTHAMIMESGVFNLSVLSEATPFQIYQRFGFQSGKSMDKFSGFSDTERSCNDILYLNKDANALISAKVNHTVDLGSHTLFVGDVTEDKVLSDIPSVTYQYYFDHVKPKPEAGLEKKTGFVCKICGYVYEGDVLPPDFICPLCKHGAEDFQPL